MKTIELMSYGPLYLPSPFSFIFILPGMSLAQYREEVALEEIRTSRESGATTLERCFKRIFKTTRMTVPRHRKHMTVKVRGFVFDCVCLFAFLFFWNKLNGLDELRVDVH